MGWEAALKRQGVGPPTTGVVTGIWYVSTYEHEGKRFRDFLMRVRHAVGKRRGEAAGGGPIRSTLVPKAQELRTSTSTWVPDRQQGHVPGCADLYQNKWRINFPVELVFISHIMLIIAVLETLKIGRSQVGRQELMDCLSGS